MIRKNKFFKKINWRIRFGSIFAIAIMVLSAILFWMQGVHGEVIDPISGEVTWKDEPNKIIDSDIIILSGGKLTIDNSIVKMNCFSEGQHKIEVRDGGELIIINNSKITASYSNHEYNFYFLQGSKGSIADSTIEECGYSSGGSKGVRIESDNVTIEDSTIQNCYNGIYAKHSSPMISNSTIKNNDQSGIYWEEGIMLWQDLFNDASKTSTYSNVIFNVGDVIFDCDEYSTDANTVGLYHLNTGSGSTATDSSGNNNDGSIGYASWTTTARFGSYALDFDGDDDYIDFGDVFDESTGSIEMWFNLENNFNSSASSDMMLFSKYAKSQGKEYSVRLKFEADDGKIYFIITKQGTPYSITSNSASWIDDTWCHVAATWGSNGMKMYINNSIQTDTDPYTGYWEDKSSNAYIGASKDGAQYEDEFDGIIDEFRVSDLQRSAFLDEYADSGSITSTLIESHQFNTWNELVISKTEPDSNHYINVSILDSTDIVIDNFQDLTGSEIDISSIHASEYSSIKLKADFYGNGSTYPSLHGWLVDGTTTIYNNTIESNNIGIYLENSSPTFLNNTIKDNSNSGIKVVSCSPIIKNNNITSDGNGDGIYFEDSYPILFYNTIDNCEIGIKAIDSPTIPSASTIKNNTLYGVNEPRGLYFVQGSSPPVYLGENTTYIDVPNPKFSVITNATIELISQPALYWSNGDWGTPEIKLNNDTDVEEDNMQRNPSIAAVNDKIYVVWDDNRSDDYDIYFNSYNGSVWNSDSKICNDSDYEDSDQILPAITAEGNEIYVVWQDNRSDHWDIYFNKYNGTAWGNTDNRVCRDPGTDDQESPKIAVDSGYVYAVWQDDRNGDYDIYFNDYDGTSWNNTDIEINNDPGSSNQLNPSIAADNGKIYVVWQDDRNGDYDIFFNQYNGTAWGTTDVKICNGTSNSNQVYPSVTAESGSVYVTWKDNRSGKYEVYFNKYDGSSWGSTDLEISNIPTNKASKDSTFAPIGVENGNLYVAWEDNRSGEWDIYYNKYNGNSWGIEDVKISDLPIYNIELPMFIEDQEPSGTNHIKPSLDIENGNISVPWQREYPTAENPHDDIYFNNYKPRFTIKFPTNLALDVGNDDDIQWNCTGEVIYIKTIPNFADELNSYLIAHENDDEEYITIPLVFYSDTGGYLNITNIRIIYDIEPPVIFGNTILNCDYGFFLNGSSPEITNNTIQGSDEEGIHYENTTAVIINNKILSNDKGIYIDPNIHSQEIREHSKREYKFEDTYTNTSKIDTTGSGNLSLTNGEVKLLHKTDWWNTNWRYRRNITISETLDINRTNEYHDFTIDFSSWSNKPNSANDVRIVNSSGSEVNREIVTFDADDYVKFTIPISSLNHSESDYIHMYYGNPSPTTPTSVDYNQTTIIWDENASISDLGGWPGSSNVVNTNITSISTFDNSTSVLVTPAKGNQMIRIKGKDNSLTSDTYYYVKFSTSNYTVQSGWYLGYFIYKNSTSPNGAGLDGNYSDDSGNLSDGIPKAYDQNNLPLHPKTNTSSYSDEQWYYRYTDDIGSKSIDEWWIAYNDNTSSETGNFTYFFDYIFIGPNKGPLNTSINNEEVYYSTYGLLLSQEINLSSSSLGGYVEISKKEYQNHNILVSVLDENNNPISKLTNYNGTKLGISSIDYFTYPKIKLQALFSSNGSKTPKLYSWNLSWVETISSYSIQHNKIKNNTIGIYCDQASAYISNNDIISNTGKGIFYNKCEAYDYTTSTLADDEYKMVTFELSGFDSSAELVVPKGATVTDASFNLTGIRYIPNSDVSKRYEYQGYATNETTDLSLNGTINVSIPTNWEAIEGSVTKVNLTQNGIEIEASVANLSCEHNSSTKSMIYHNDAHYYSNEISKSQNPLQFNLTVNLTNILGNFTASVYSTKSTSLSWTLTSVGYTITVPLNSPNVNISSPKLNVVPPDTGFAEYNGTIVETGQYVTEGISQDSSNLILDLTTVTGIGEVWELNDSNYNVTINLTYYTKSPSLDVGWDGDIDWQYSGEFNSTVTINKTNNGLVRELNELISALGAGDEEIKLGLRSQSAGKINISDVSISWELAPQTIKNTISDNNYGVFIEDSTNVSVLHNIIGDNEYGIYISNATNYVVSGNTLSDGTTMKTITFSRGYDNTCKLLIPAGAVVTNASFNLSGSRYVPADNSNGSHKYQGMVLKSENLVLNDNINITKPTGWLPENAYLDANGITNPAGDGVALWSNNSNYFSSSQWNRSSWIGKANQNLPNITWVRSAACPNSEIVTALTLDSQNYIKAIKWDGNVWGTPFNLTSASTTNNTTCFDIAFETLSGNAIAVWSNNSNKFEYSVWNGSSWGKGTSISISNIKWIKLASYRYSDEIVALTLDNNKNLNALYWDGSAWNTSTWTLTTNATTADYECFDVIYNNTGHAIAAWSNNSNELDYSVWNGTSWSIETSISVNEVYWVEMEHSDYKKSLAVTLNKSKSIKAYTWDTSSWSTATNLTSFASTNNTKCFDTTFDHNKEEFMIVWSENSTNFSYRIWNRYNWSNTNEISINNIKWINMDSAADDSKISSLTLDNSNNIKSQIWNGTAWTLSETLTTTTTTTTSSCFDLVFEAPREILKPSIIDLEAVHNSNTREFGDT